MNNSSAIVIFFESIFPASKYKDQPNVILKSIRQKHRDYMACASIQCKITNRIDLNLICLCLSVAIQHVQATRLIYSVRNVFAKTNLQEVFSIYMSNIIQIILIDLKTSLNFKSCFFLMYNLDKNVDCGFFFFHRFVNFTHV